MDNLYVIAIILAAVVGGLFVIPFAKKNGWITKYKTDGMKQMLLVTRLVLDVIKTDKLDKTKATFALDIADRVVDYVNEHMDDNVDKRAISLRIIEDLLAKNAVIPTDSERQLIEIIIDEALKRVK
ncbi:hypothetical protein HUB98_06540 [Paenibacillus barcinonensis]|uniref:Uncharacterized protein n=1 Tax=Paenibacillus barcinonensis TaxID=198119 RepID=A0A2V4W0M7_PAEBA|nr:hypothetical protein [Paenibacillus barcinonensis]PYE51675.1 hypothetical protein DFQ00_102470 [Paenibacillus barcinonensis]QKS56035.1 hypothetical protein HUB98_06540 [Paenibacillus barcinonensis]